MKTSDHPLFATWWGMVQRCHYPKSVSYPRYGAKGITVCQRWRKFANFVADMGEKPEGYQLDRIDNSGNYEPGNCRWVTPSENSKNRKTNRMFTINGETKNLSEWVEQSGIKKSTVSMRLQYGWPIERALNLTGV